MLAPERGERTPRPLLELMGLRARREVSRAPASLCKWNGPPAADGGQEEQESIWPPRRARQWPRFNYTSYLVGASLWPQAGRLAGWQGCRVDGRRPSPTTAGRGLIVLPVARGVVAGARARVPLRPARAHQRPFQAAPGETRRQARRRASSSRPCPKMKNGPCRASARGRGDKS